MGAIHSFKPVGLFMGVLTTHPELRDEVVGLLEARLGPVWTQSTPFPFSFTDYYDEEMGGRPERCFLLFKNLVDPSTLAQIKIFTNSVEEKFLTEGGGRKVNLDPGLLSAGSLILATTKNRSHRIPLNDGIYAETTLIFYKGQFNALPWSYADYASDPVRALLKQYRSMYMDMSKRF